MTDEFVLAEAREWCQKQIAKAVAAEKERCAVLADKWDQMYERRAKETRNLYVEKENRAMQHTARMIARDIRAVEGEG